MSKIGIDVGGTNTDALVLDGSSVLAAVKTGTTADVTTGIATALALLLEQPGVDRSAIEAVIVGTTHFTNAVVARQGLRRVMAVRVCLPASAAITPFMDWPDDLRDVVSAGHRLLGGGHEYDGREIAPFDADGMARVAREIADSGVEAVAISAVFSPLNPSCEEAAAAILRAHAPNLRRDPVAQARPPGGAGARERRPAERVADGAGAAHDGGLHQGAARTAASRRRST